MPQNPVHRRLGVKSSHRLSILRNLATSLIEHESLTTTFSRAKEAQGVVEKLITLAKRGSTAARASASKRIYAPRDTMTKLFTTLAERYADRPGGYTRIMRIEARPEDQAPSAILELVDGPKDMRFAMTARTLARCRVEEKELNEITLRNVQKVTQLRSNGKQKLDETVQRLTARFEKLHPSQEVGKVQPTRPRTRGSGNRFRVGNQRMWDGIM